MAAVIGLVGALAAGQTSLPASQPSSAPATGAPATQPSSKAEALPEGALARFGEARLHHGGYVQSIAFSPDGKVLASGGGQYGQKSSVYLWDTATGVLIREIGEIRSGVMSISFSGDGRILATASQDQAVSLWDAATGKAAEGLATGGRVRGQWIDLSADGKLLVANEGGNIKVIDTASGTAKATLGQGNWATFTPDGKGVLVSSMHNHNPKAPPVALYETATGKLVRKYDLNGNQLGSAVVSPDGKLFAASSLGGPDAQNVLVVNVETGKIAEKVPGMAWYGRTVSFSADSKRIAFGSQTGVVTVRELGKEKPAGELGMNNQLAQHVLFSPDGKLLATASNMGQIRLWDATTYKEKLIEGGHRSDVQAAALSPCGKYVLTGSDDGSARLWSAGEGKELRRLGDIGASVTATAFGVDANGVLLAAAASRDTVTVTTAASGAKVLSAKLEGAAGCGGYLGFLPGGKLACVSAGGVYSVLNIASGKVGQVGKAAEKAVAANMKMSVTADGQLAALGGMGQMTTVWETATGRQRAVVGAVAGGAYMAGIGLDPLGQFLAADFMQKVVVYEVDSSKTFREIPTAGRVHGGQTMVAFSSDGMVFAVGDSMRGILLYSLTTGESLGKFTGHRNRITSMAFSADGKRMLTGSADTTAILWNLEGVKRPGATAKLDANTFDGLWKEMAASEASRGMGAVLALAAAGDEGVELLGKKLESVKGPKADDVAKLVEGLGDRTYAVRQRSYEELGKLGVLVEASLRQAVKDIGAEEVRARAEELLSAMDDPSRRSGEALRQIRAVHALQRIGTPKALAVLDVLAKGAPGANLTERAKQAAERMRTAGVGK